METTSELIKIKTKKAEKNRLLKVALPLDVHGSSALS